MGATAESGRAASRERRLLREVDPELADELDRRDLEAARKRAKGLRAKLGMEPKEPEPTWRDRVGWPPKKPKPPKPEPKPRKPPSEAARRWAEAKAEAQRRREARLTEGGKP